MVRRLILIVLILGIDLAGFSVPVSAAGAVSVSAWNCGDADVDPSSDSDAFADACITEVANSTFALTADDVTRRRATAIGKPAAWPAVAGDFTLKIDNPFGLSSSVFCRFDDGEPVSYTAEDDQIAASIGDSTAVSCAWYLYASAPEPTSTPTPTATARPTQSPTEAPEVEPTATQRSSAPTAMPTATPRTTATPAGTDEETTPSTGELPDPPTLIYPPAMFRGNSARTGEHVGPGPEGDPLLLWRFPIGERPVSSPVRAGDIVYVGGEYGLYAIDARTGTLLWLFNTGGVVESSAAVVDGLVYFGGMDGALYCLDAQTGVERWRYETNGKIITSPLVADGWAYTVSYDGNLYSIDAMTGDIRWQFSIDGTEYVSSPAVVDNLIVVGSGSIDGGYLYGVEADSGVELWRHQVAGSIGSTPAIVDGIAYFGSDDGYAYAFDVFNEERIFRLGTGRLIRSSPAVFDGAAYYGNRAGSLYAFDVLAEEQLWEFESGDWVDSSPSFVDGRIYVATKKRRFFILNPADGSMIWDYETGTSITTSPWIEGGVVYLAGRDGFLYAIGGTESAADIAEAAADTGKPMDVPLELWIDYERYLFDRMVEIDPSELNILSSVGEMIYYTHDDDRDTGAIYANRPAHDEESETVETELARYLPEYPGSDGVVCAAEAARSAAIISDGQSTFAFAGAEPDLPLESLSEVASSPELGTVYSNTAEPPFKELYVEDGVLQRYVLLDGDGLPEHLRGYVPFNGQIYTFVDDVTEETNEDDLLKVGCSGLFAAFVEPGDEAAPYPAIIVSVAGQLLQFEAVEPTEP